MKHLSVLTLTLSIGLWACQPSQPRYVRYPGPAATNTQMPTQVRRGKPPWVDGQAVRYPKMQYMTGVGRGNVRQACESDARAAIAKIFESKVKQVSSDWMGHFSQVNATGKVQIEGMTVSQITQVSTDYVVKGVNIAEVYQDGPTFHCLATLERHRIAATLRDAIDKLDAEINSAMTLGDQASTDTDKFLSYKKAMLLMQRRDALNAELRIVSPRGDGRKAPIGWAEIIAKFTGVSKKVKIGLKIKGRDAKKIQTCLAEQLTQRKMTITETSNDVDLFITGAMHWQKAGYNNGQFMVKVDVNMRIMNMDNGKTVGAISEELKSGRPQISQALQTTTTKLCHVLAPKLADKIMKALTR